jgi:hypothetical protein
MRVPNYQHNSGKPKRTKGTCKGKLKARKQALQHLKMKLGRTDKPSFSFAGDPSASLMTPCHLV